MCFCIQTACILSGHQQSEQPVRINGVLKKVWRSMGSTRAQWQSVSKPEIEAVATAAAAAAAAGN